MPEWWTAPTTPRAGEATPARSRYRPTGKTGGPADMPHIAWSVAVRLGIGSPGGSDGDGNASGGLDGKEHDDQRQHWYRWRNDLTTPDNTRHRTRPLRRRIPRRGLPPRLPPRAARHRPAPPRTHRL